jgi:hypothetical protein
MSSPVFIDAEDAVRRQALHGERAGDAHLAVILVGAVVEVLELRLRGDGGVDLALAGDALLPEGGEQWLSGWWPVGRAFAGDFPLLERLREAGGGRQLLAERRELAFVLLPDDVDLGVIGDVAELDVWHALVDEAVADVSARPGLRGGRASDFGLLQLPLAAVREEVVRITRAHDPRPREGQRNPRCIDGDPATAPLLCDVGRSAGAARRVEHEVAGISGHENTAFDHTSCGLNHVP